MFVWPTNIVRPHAAQLMIDASVNQFCLVWIGLVYQKICIRTHFRSPITCLHLEISIILLSACEFVMVLNRRQLLLLAAQMLLEFVRQNNLLLLQLVCLLGYLHRFRQLQCAAVLAYGEGILLRRRRRRQRRRPLFWVLPRPQESWFEIHYDNDNIPDDYFRRQLRLNRMTFDLLLEVLGPRLTRRDTRMRNCIPPEKILALALSRLGHGTSYVAIGPKFNVGRSTVLEATQDVVNALCDLKDDYIRFPETQAEIARCKDTFQGLSDLPNIVGAIACSHIAIKAPHNPSDYFSRYQRYDVVVQAVVDGTTRFLDISVGYPGSMHDARVLRNSRLYVRAENKEILSEPTLSIEGHEIGPYVVGDSGFPLSRWLQKPFAEHTNDSEEIRFNKELSSAHVKVECAFAILKNRWSILQKRLDSRITFISKIIVACAVLHNFCLRVGDLWDEERFDDESINDENPEIMAGGEVLRDVLRNYVSGL